MTLYQAAATLSTYLARQVDLPQKQVDTLRFGLEIIIGTLIKGTLLFTLAWAMNILIEVMVALLVGSGFRLLAGGAHANGYMRCLILGVTVYLATGWTATTYTLLLPPHLLLIGFLFCFVSVLRWAPGKVPGKELTPSKQRQFKLLSLLYLFSWLGGMLYLFAQSHLSLALAGFLGLMAQGYSLTPMGYWLIERYDSLLSGKHGKGVAADVGQV